MTDIIKCPECGSDKGFKIINGEVYCKKCQAIYKSLTVREYFKVRNWLPEGINLNAD